MKRASAARARQLSILAFRLDLLRELGPRYAARRALENITYRRLLVGRRARVPQQMWLEAARELGAEVRELAPTMLEFRLDGVVARVRGQTTPFADPISGEVASNKPLAYRLLAEAGLPVPAHELVSVRDLATAWAFVQRVGPPCIVKPAQGGGGAGVTGEVRTRPQLRRALISAGRYHHEALLEQQLPGDSYRLLLLDGEVLDVIQRPRPRVIGDGSSTVQELMFRQYRRRIDDDSVSGLKPFVVDLDCLFTLAQAGYSADSVLPAGASLVVKTATNYNGPDESVTVQRPYPERFETLARRAAETLAVRLAGVDLLAGDDADAIVLEVNPVPGLTHHYNVADADRAARIAVPILASLLHADPARAAASAP